MLRYNASAVAAFLIRAVLLGNRPLENVGYLIRAAPPILKRHFRRAKLLAAGKRESGTGGRKLTESEAPDARSGQSLLPCVIWT